MQLLTGCTDKIETGLRESDQLSACCVAVVTSLGGCSSSKGESPVRYGVVSVKVKSEKSCK